MKTFFGIMAVLIVMLGLEGCIVPFSPPEVTAADKFLVVDGFLNTGAKDSSRIQLSYTQLVTNKNAFTAAVGAQVIVEGNKGSVYNFTEIGKGLYRLAPRTFNEAEQFRLRIRTSTRKEYVSSYVEVKQTPPIDSITYKIAADKSAVQININTHDPRAKTRFYRWKFEETWEYRMSLYSLYEVKNNAIIDRVDNINTCWSSEKPSTILLASTIKLTQDLIRDIPITNVPTSSNKMLVKYSILVKQYGLTQEGFEYWTNLAKTTETTGSLFDPQPSQVTGNIKSTSDSKELVFGFFSAVAPQEQRIFITPSLGRYEWCVPTDTLSAAEALKSPDLLLSEYWPEGARVPQYITGDHACTDCRTRGGTIIRPSFWQ